MSHNHKEFLCRALLSTFITSSALWLSSCTEESASHPTTAAAQQDKPFKQILAEHKNKNDKKGEVAQGIELMLAGNYDEAGQKFNRLLNNDPTNATAHLLNGINYQLKAAKGDPNLLDIAEAGFVQALKFNPSSALASLQLGRVKKTKKEYQKAQEEFANALLLEPNNKDALYELATTSYLMGDLKTARVTIERSLKAQPSKVEVLQSAALIRAASGDSKGAKEALMKLAAVEAGSYRAKEAQRRVLDWKKLYDQGLITLAQAAPAENISDPISTATTFTGGNASAQPMAGAPAAPAALPGAKPTMVVIDALVMRNSEAATSAKGNNILNNFGITLAPGTHVRARYKNINGSGPGFGANVFPPPFNAAAGTAGTVSITTDNANRLSVARLFAQGISFSSIQYSLNIANSFSETIQVMDRPSVTTILGQKGEFFSGTDYVLGLTGQYGGSISHNPVGIELVVTPTAYDPATDTVTLDIRLYGSLGDIAVADVAVTQKFAQFNVSRVYTTVNMKMGETLMLGGIQTRTDLQANDGFPILKDIPFVQYLFSNESTSSIRKVVTFLITPRLAADAKKLTQAHLEKGKPEERPILSELELRHKDWFTAPVPNWVIHFRMMDGLYRDFRFGDVPNLVWENSISLEQQLEGLKSFFYY